jgi:hypothetical protein
LRIHRADDNASFNAKLVNDTRLLVAQGRKLLAQPAPDTFLGRDRHCVEPKAPELKSAAPPDRCLKSWRRTGLLRRSSAKLLRNFVAGSSQWRGCRQKRRRPPAGELPEAALNIASPAPRFAELNDVGAREDQSRTTFLRIVIRLCPFCLSMIFSENRCPLFRIML